MLEEERIAQLARQEFTDSFIQNRSGVQSWFVADDLKEAFKENNPHRINELKSELKQIKLKALQLEENVYCSEIAAGKAAKAEIANYIIATARNTPQNLIEVLISQLTATFDENISRAEQQLANLLKKYSKENEF